MWGLLVGKTCLYLLSVFKKFMIVQGMLGPCTLRVTGLFPQGANTEGHILRTDTVFGEKKSNSVCQALLYCTAATGAVNVEEGHSFY